MVTSAAERKAVAHLVADHGMSERQACKAIGCCHINVRYKTTRPDGGDLRDRMMAIAHERRRFGYKRLHVMLRREVFVVNHKRLFRLYCKANIKIGPPLPNHLSWLILSTQVAAFGGMKLT